MRVRQQPSYRLPMPGGRRLPPDYTQRSVKLRLFALLAMLMLVLAVIERARDPQAWQWLWDLDRMAAEQQRFESRLQQQEPRTAGDPVGTIVATPSPRPAEEQESQLLDAADRAWQQGWSDVLSRLAVDDRDLLFELLYHAGRHEALNPAKSAAAAALLAQLERLWDDYLASARRSLSSLASEDQAQWTAVIEEQRTRFLAGVQPALARAAAGESLSNEQTATLSRFEATLDKVARSSVQDDTVVFRPAERDYWFHQLARVKDADPAKLPHEQAPRVSYLQLAKQPADYRGRPVTIAGTVRQAERVAAPANYLGIKEYYAYWLQPAGGPDSPVVVYALAAPPGFPPVKSRDDHSRVAAGKLREEVEVTGVFIKRCAYAAQGGTYTAPVLIAHAPRWQRPEPSAVARRPMTSLELAAVSAGALVVAICLTAVVWKRSGARSRDARPPLHGGLVSLGNLAVGPSTEESLRELERKAQGDDAPQATT